MTYRAIPFRNFANRCANSGLFLLLAIAQLNSAEAQILSEKRGFAGKGGDHQTVGADWYYGWGFQEGDTGNLDIDFYPMFWGGGSVNQSNINAVKNDPDVEWVLGFNEPERTDQANISVATAIDRWTTLSNGFSGSGKKLVSPAVSDTADGKAWITDFMTQAQDASLQIDAVAFHWYGWSNPNNIQQAFSNFKSSMNWYHQWGLPVFVTEFAIHDWGNNYTDEEIEAANEQFLDLAVPWMESTSWVEGYAWYHWFSDARLYENGKPTPMGYEYTGVLESGETEDIGGQNIGEHIAFLAGGNLTMSTPGTVRYIRALENNSSLIADTPWEVNDTNGWVQVDSGATLRKTGGSQLTLNGISAINDGTVEVAEGTLRLQETSSVDGSGTWRVKAGGTLNVTGDPRDDFATVHFPVELQGGSLGTDAAFGLRLDSGTMLRGAGTVTNDLLITGDSTLQVGASGLAANPNGTLNLVEDFENYTLATFTGGSTASAYNTPGGPWSTNTGTNTNFVAIENDGDNYLTFGWNNGERGANRTVTSIVDGEVGTYYFQIYTEDSNANASFGLSDEPSGSLNASQDFEVQIGLVNNGGLTLRARNGGVFENLVSGLSSNTWYDIWLVVDNSTDTYDVYYGTTGDPNTMGTLLASDLGFRNGTATNDLTTFMTLELDNQDLTSRIDNIYYRSPPDGAGIFNGGEALTVQGNFSMVAGTTLALDIYDPNSHDQLIVQGDLSAGGTLQVDLDPNAPALVSGDTFDLLSFGSSLGAFDTLLLPALDADLIWDTSNLLTTGILSVASSFPLGDFNMDGKVDGMDFLLWQRNPEVGNLADWESQYGTSLAATALVVPEPSCLILAVGLAFSFHSRLLLFGSRRFRTTQQSGLK